MTDRSLRVLLVEDDDDDYILIRDILTEVREQEFNLDWVDNYDKALEKINQHQYDIFLLDYLLGERTGIDLMKAMTGMDLHAPIIFLTGLGDYEIDVAAMRMGADDYLVKENLNAALLERSIRYALERKKTQAVIYEQERLLRTVLDALPVGVWITDKQGKIISVNPAGKRIWGGAEYVGKDHYDHYKGWWLGSGKQITNEEWALSRALQNKETSIGEVIKIETFDGKQKTIINSALPILDKAGNISAIVMVNEDITDILQKEKDLQYSKQRFRKLVESMDDIVFTLDNKQRFNAIFGNWIPEMKIKPAEMIGKTVHEIFDTDAAILHEEANKRVFKGEPTTYEWSFKCDSQRFYFQNSLSPLYDSNGNIEGIVGVARNITNQKRFEKQLIYTEKLLAVGEMSAMISHEFRNALTSVRMILELQTESFDIDQQQRNMLQVALKSINHMEDIVSQLLSFARPKELEFRQEDLNFIIKESLAFTKMQTEKLGIEIVKSLSHEIPYMALDPNHIKETFINLIMNSAQAIKNIPSRSTKRISIATKIETLDETLRDIPLTHFQQKLTVENAFQYQQELIIPAGTKCVLVEVSDSGGGISPNQIDRIFDPFYTTKPTGTGLGLSMVKRTINSHGGIITLHNKPGDGVSFKIYLPLER